MGLRLIRDSQVVAQRIRDNGIPPTRVLDGTYQFSDGTNLTTIVDGVTSARNETYTYTTTNRLQQGTGTWGTLDWTYDLVGNRTSEVLTSGATTIRSPTTGSRPSPRARRPCGRSDRAGTVYNYRYNNGGWLDRLTIGSTVTADYAYDGLERMAIRTTQNMSPAGTTHYLYDLGGHLLAEADATGATLREYVWLDDLPLAVVSDVNTAAPNLYFVHADQLKRPLRMTDLNKAVVWDAVYRPFGEVVSITGPASNNLRFPGQYFLIEDGLHYNWYRQYDPTIGRYLQRDPLDVLSAAPTNSLKLTPSPPPAEFGTVSSDLPFGRRNVMFSPGKAPSAYQYADANPLAVVDPKGLQASAVCIAGGPANPACGVGVALDIARGLCIGISLFVASRSQSGGPLQRCLRAAEGSDADWDSFCGSIPFGEKNNVFGEGPARLACERHRFSSTTEKRNWCQNQYGKR